MADAGIWPYLVILLAVSGLVLLSALLGFAGKPRLKDLSEAVKLASNLPGGFAMVSGALDRGGHGAILSDHKGRIAIVAPHGAHFVVRLAGPQTRLETNQGALMLRLGTIEAKLELGAAHCEWTAQVERCLLKT